jgi:hypothetical protein
MNIFDYYRCFNEINQKIEPFLYWGSREKLNLFYQTFSSRSKKMKEKKNEPITWGISIDRQNPLIFCMNDFENSKLYVDVTCDIQGIVDSPTAEKTKITKYNIELRIWSQNKETSFRKGLDSNDLQSQLESQNWKRVMLRFHMDIRNSSAIRSPEPICHLHAGGDSEDHECCWMPKELDVPRFYHYPMDIVLLIEFVLTNFFPEKSECLRNDPEWISIIRDVQDFYLRTYMTNLCRYLNREQNTLLGHLVSI